jgi:23S rRNA pseudouridine2605 synthase
MAEQRLQKILAQAGVASRRAAEQLITQGRVRVNGRIVSELGARANPIRDRVEVDGRRLVAERPVYFLMHKPRGVVTTLDDPEGRKSIKDLLRGIPERLFPVGRLDFQTSGALLLTNDGSMAQALLHPTRAVPKTYHAKIEGSLDDKRLELLRSGVTLDDGERTAPAEVVIMRRDDKHTFIEVTISEGKNRQIHRMLDAVGRVVLRLTRIAFAELSLEGLRAGQMRPLATAELSDLKQKYLNPSKKFARERRDRDRVALDDVASDAPNVPTAPHVPPTAPQHAQFEEQDEEPPRPREPAAARGAGRGSSPRGPRDPRQPREQRGPRGRAPQPEQTRVGVRGAAPRRDRVADAAGPGARKVGARERGAVRQRVRGKIDPSERVKDARVRHVSTAKRAPPMAQIVEPRARVDARTARRGRKLDATGRDGDDERKRTVRDPRAQRGQKVVARNPRDARAKRQRRR